MPQKQTKDKILKWNLNILYKSLTDPQIEKDLAKGRKLALGFAGKYKKKQGWETSASQLKKALAEYFKLAEWGVDNQAGYYLSLKQSLDLQSPQIQAKLNLLIKEATETANLLTFFDLRLSQINKKDQQKLLKNPSLAYYQPFLKQIFTSAPHRLSEEAENVISLKQSPAHADWVHLTEAGLHSRQAKLPGPDKKTKDRSWSEILSLTAHKQKKIRQPAIKAAERILADQTEVATAEINAVLKNKQINDNLRKFNKAEEARLLGDQISIKSVNSLLETIKQNYKLSHRFYQLKTKLLGQDKITYPERNISIGQLPDNISFNDSLNMVKEAVNQIDPQFSDILTNLVKNRQIDSHPKAGKTGGGFCAHYLPHSPTFILLNHTGRLTDVLTLAHELGHAIHNQLMKEQPAPYFDHSLALAETASTLLESHTFDYLLNQLSPEQRLTLLMEKLNSDVATIFRQTAAYLFERDLHQNFRQSGYLATKDINRLFTLRMKAYLGSAIKTDSEVNNWWIHWSHFRSFFYVYSYAYGFLTAQAIKDKINNNSSEIEAVKNMLATGGTKTPTEALAMIKLNPEKNDIWLKGLQDFEIKLKEAERLAKTFKISK
ncbi:MAG: M3 family metallopeptidase [Patescibacteria group bacterium]